MLSLIFLVLSASTCIYGDIRGQNFTVTAFITSGPFINWKPNGKSLTGNDRFEGMLIDFMDEISTSLKFNYAIHEVADHRYGQPKGNGTWDGMMGEVISGVVDMALADITITARREAAVDFTHPFKQLGLSVLIKEGSIAVNSLEEIANNPAIQVGAVRGGSTMSYLRHSKIPMHENLWHKMDADNTLTNSNQEGVNRVLAGTNFAFILESPSMEYMKSRNCELRQVGDIFNHKSYGLALPTGSPYREELSVAILKLQESGRMEQIIDTWIRGSSCDQGGTTEPAQWGLNKFKF